MSSVPNTIHFINLGPREFSLVHFISVYSAYNIQKPDNIIIHCTHVQKNNIFWELLKNIVTINHVDLNEYIDKYKFESYQYYADILRMEILIQQGGIYMDLDILSLQSYSIFLDQTTIGVEKMDENDENVVSLSNAIILAKPYDPFIIEWYNQMLTCVDEKNWAYHAVVLPKLILEKNNYDVRVVNKKTFIPFCYRDTFIFENKKIDKWVDLNESCTIHLWETLWAGILNNIEIDYFYINKNIFTHFYKEYIDIIRDNRDVLLKIITDLYKSGEKHKIDYYNKMYMDLLILHDKFQFDKKN